MWGLRYGLIFSVVSHCRVATKRSIRHWLLRNVADTRRSIAEADRMLTEARDALAAVKEKKL